MIIISDCLTSKVDEGCLKVANSLAVKLKALYPETMIVSYDRKPAISDRHLRMNKLFLSKALYSIIHKSRKPVLYIPFASNTTASAIRVVMLSLFSNRKNSVIFVLRYQMNALTRIMLKLSKANIIALSRESYNFYKSLVGCRAYYLKTGIDTEKFKPVGLTQKIALKQKYGIPTDIKVVLHVGHLKTDRNIDKLELIDEKYFVLLVVSSLTENERNEALRAKLENRPNTMILDYYIENIQEVYQMSDVYIFPVLAENNCIDIPLSVLEAAACNIAVVTTPYGELKELIHSTGFYQLNSFNESDLNSLVDLAVNSTDVDTRSAVLDYDWMRSADKLESIVEI